MLQRVTLQCDEARIAWNTLLICLAFCERDFASAMAASANFAVRDSLIGDTVEVRRRRTYTTIFRIVPGMRAAPLPKPIRYRPVTLELEAALVRAYREDGDLDALDWLVGAHRPEVITSVRSLWRGGSPDWFKALVEYGMLGLRFAAEPIRPSLTKAGEMVGFDPEGEGRFSTYSRHYAEKQIRAALSLDPPTLEQNPEIVAKAEDAAVAWHMAPSLFGMHDAPDFSLLTKRTLVQRGADLIWIAVQPHRKPYRPPWPLWSCTEARRRQMNDVRRLVGLEEIPRWHWRSYRPVTPRNYLKHPVTDTERANRRRRPELQIDQETPIAAASM
jgi:hypothetical protein